jgi:AraC family transcriptional regulator
VPERLHSLDNRLIEWRGDLSVAPAVRRLLESAGQTLSPAQASVRRLIDQAIALLDQNPVEVGLLPRAGRSCGGLAPWQVKRVSEFIDKHLASPLPIGKLGAIVNLSPSHFCRAFKTCLGVSPHAYIMGKRVEKAQELMLGTDEPLVQIALSCGLASQSHLCLIYRRVIGCSPGAWRRRYRTGDREIASPRSDRAKHSLELIASS